MAVMPSGLPFTVIVLMVIGAWYEVITRGWGISFEILALDRRDTIFCVSKPDVIFERNDRMSCGRRKILILYGFFGITAVASISTKISSRNNLLTCTSVLAGA